MKRPIAVLAVLAGTCCLSLTGCQRKTTTVTGLPKVTKQEDNLKQVLDLLRQGTDIGHYRDALNSLNTHLSRETSQPVTPLSSEVAAELKKQFHLDADELADINSILFRPLDAYHVQSCLLFRDASRSIELSNLPAIEQARLCFQWAMRRVQLHEQGDTGLPAAFVLQRGFGSARDRAITYLALLRQFQIEGCLLTEAPPAEGPEKALLVGVLIPSDAKPDLYLFDPRRGEPVSSDKAGRVATLEQARANPKLLEPAGLTGEAAGKLQVCQATPLEALSARMRYLQELLAFQDKVVLFQDAVALARDLGKAGGGGEVMTWNDANKSSTGQVTPAPTRALRQFVSAAEGGLDRQGRHKRFLMQQIPVHGIFQQFQRLRLMQAKDIPEPARDMLLRKTEELFRTFYVQPEEQFLHGQYDAMMKRVGRIRTVLETEEAATPLTEAEIESRLEEWRGKVREAYVSALVRKEAGGQNKVNNLWTEDQYLINLLQVDSEIPLQKFDKKTLSLILFEACREPLGQQVAYLIASALHEKAAQQQAGHDFLVASGKDAGFMKQNLGYAWKNARGAWTKYLERHRLHPTDKSSPRDLPQRLTAVEERAGRGDPATAVDLLEQLHLEMHATFEARLRLAEVQQYLQTGKNAGSALNDLRTDLDAFEKSGLPRLVREIREKVPPTSPLAQRLNLLGRDWQPQGYLYWIRQSQKAPG